MNIADFLRVGHVETVSAQIWLYYHKYHNIIIINTWLMIISFVIILNILAQLKSGCEVILASKKEFKEVWN